MIYKVATDDYFGMLLCCAGFEYHSQMCALCASDGPDTCPIGDSILDHFMDIVTEHSFIPLVKKILGEEYERSGSNQNVN